jgi:hypothetical protein
LGDDKKNNEVDEEMEEEEEKLKNRSEGYKNEQLCFHSEHWKNKYMNKILEK